MVPAQGRRDNNPPQRGTHRGERHHVPRQQLPQVSAPWSPARKTARGWRSPHVTKLPIGLLVPGPAASLTLQYPSAPARANRFRNSGAAKTDVGQHAIIQPVQPSNGASIAQDRSEPLDRPEDHPYRQPAEDARSTDLRRRRGKGGHDHRLGKGSALRPWCSAGARWTSAMTDVFSGGSARRAWLPCYGRCLRP